MFDVFSFNNCVFHNVYFEATQALRTSKFHWLEPASYNIRLLGVYSQVTL